MPDTSLWPAIRRPGGWRDWALGRALEMALDPGAVREPAHGRRRLAEVLAGEAG